MRIKVDSGGGLQAVIYTFKKSLEVGPIRLWKRMRAKNACKTCALGMGGMQGGMVNEEGHFPEVCKKSLQAQVADMQGALDADYFDNNPLDKLLTLTPKRGTRPHRVQLLGVTHPAHINPVRARPRQDHGLLAGGRHAHLIPHQHVNIGCPPGRYGVR